LWLIIWSRPPGIDQRGGEAATIGVVTHPAYRGHGYGRAVVSAATGQGLEAGFIVLYQTLLANAPSVALATGLGYQPYATHLAVRLTSGGRAGA
jgi:GNAT superfamily N-acetyltransferase